MTNAPREFVGCHVCGSKAVATLPDYAQFQRVTSDCKPWKSGGRIGACEECGCAQAILDTAWHAEARAIYDNYTIYHQSKGVEQSVFDAASGQATSRSVRLLQRLTTELSLGKTGRLMDVGCGNGALLRAFSGISPGWSMVGLEVNDHYRSTVEAIPGVEGLLTCAPWEVSGSFQLISLMHSLEHIPSPREFIVKLRDKLDAGGLLLIQVPDCEENPFMFLVADHASHFFVRTLGRLVESAGYEILVSANDWVSKEITVVARKTGENRPSAASASGEASIVAVSRRLAWLSDQVKTARALANEGNFGLFGTSIAATWLYAELGDAVTFFVDEDPHRVGRKCFGRPVYHPHQAPAGSNVYLALPPQLAATIKRRLESEASAIRLHAPQPLAPG